MRNYLLPLIQNMYIDLIKTKKEYKNFFVFFHSFSLHCRKLAVVGQRCSPDCLQDFSLASSLLLIITTNPFHEII